MLPKSIFFIFAVTKVRYDGKIFFQKFVISDSVSTMQQYIINNINKNKQ